MASVLSQTGTVKLPDGSEVPKLPSRVRWMWDGAFAGQSGCAGSLAPIALPGHVLGHIGYASGALEARAAAMRPRRCA